MVARRAVVRVGGKLEQLPAGDTLVGQSVLDYMDPGTTSTEDLIEAMIDAGWMAAPPPAVPVNTVAPAVTGGTSIGSTLTCSTGTWTGSPTSYAYQWEADTGAGYADLPGETANTLDTTGMANGDDVRCKVVATNGDGDSLPATSNAITLSSGIARIFGFDGASEDGVGHANNRLICSKFVKTNAGAVTSAFVELGGQDGWGLARIRVVALADNAGAPGDVLWYTPELTPANASTVQTFTLPGDVSGTDAADTYWLGVAVYELPGTTRGAAVTGVTTVLVNGFNVASPPASAGTVDTSYDDYAIRVWCDYVG